MYSDHAIHLSNKMSWLLAITSKVFKIQTYHSHQLTIGSEYLFIVMVFSWRLLLYSRAELFCSWHMLLFTFRWKGRSSCGLATRHRKEEIFTTNWISTLMVYRFSRSFTFLCKWNIFPGKFNSNLESEYVFTNFTKASIFRYLVQIIKFIYSKCLRWKFWNPSQGSRLVFINIFAFCEPCKIIYFCLAI
jgi:hypothetical protein